MLNVLATQKDKTQRQIISFMNCLFISLLELQGRVAQSPMIKLTQREFLFQLFNFLLR